MKWILVILLDGTYSKQNRPPVDGDISIRRQCTVSNYYLKLHAKNKNINYLFKAIIYIGSAI
jgi:hypothetical protein